MFLVRSYPVESICHVYRTFNASLQLSLVRVFILSLIQQPYFNLKQSLFLYHFILNPLCPFDRAFECITMSTTWTPHYSILKILGKKDSSKKPVCS
jgi:hypothetical protein